MCSGTVNSSVSVCKAPLSSKRKKYLWKSRKTCLKYRTVTVYISIGPNKAVLLQHQITSLTPPLHTHRTLWKGQMIQVNSSRNSVKRKINQPPPALQIYLFQGKKKNGGTHIYIKISAKQLQKMVRRGGWSTEKEIKGNLANWHQPQKIPE